MPAPARYTRTEEVAHVVTHGLGAALAVAGLVVLVIVSARLGDAWKVVSVSVYGASLVGLYLASTLYHGISLPSVKRVFHAADHAMIFVLIAGTYTPFTLVTLRGGWGWSIFGIVWGVALAGVVLKIVTVERFPRLSVVAYVAMGWIGVVGVHKLLSALPAAGFAWLAAGGLFYSAGVVFYAWKRVPYNHAIWHLFVLAGSACHFVCVLFFVLPPTGR